MTTMIEGKLISVPAMVRAKALRLNLNLLLPNQVQDLHEDAVARFRLTGDFCGDPILLEESDYAG